MWEISNFNQTITFLLSLCVGGLFCALYDIIRAARKVCLNSFLAVQITDILLWAVYAVVTFIFLISRTNGEIRGYVLVGEALGFLLFRISLSRLLFPTLKFIFLTASKISKKIGGFLSNFYIKFESLILKLGKSLFKIYKSAKKLLKNVRRLLYTNKNIDSMEKTLNETKTKA